VFLYSGAESREHGRVAPRKSFTQWGTFRNRGIEVHNKPVNNLRSLLVAPKDHTPDKDMCGIIHQVCCKDCNAFYIGESGSSFCCRLKEHQKRESLVVHQHRLGTNHAIDWNGARIVERVDNAFRRGVKEAIHINLPQIYNSLICSHGWSAVTQRD
jgi:hypothetical protein